MTTEQKPTLRLDIDLYQSFLDDSDIPDAQKRELLEMLWNIICEFVRLGFGVHPLQQLMPNDSEKPEKSMNDVTSLLPSMVKCIDHAFSEET